MSIGGPASPRFYDGGEAVAPQAIHSTPLGYDRSRLTAGTVLPLPPSAELVDQLGGCERIEVALQGKLGDSLLALSAVRAVADWLALKRGSRPAPLSATGPYAGLIRRSSLVGWSTGSLPDRTGVLIGDRAGIDERGEAGMVSIVCDPAAPPCWSSADHVYPELPARYYLALERRLGVRLPAARPFAPLLAARPDRFSALVEQLRVDGWLSGLTIAAITATSWPQRKDYSVDRFTEVAHLVAERQRVRVQLLIVGGQHSDGMSVVSSSGSSRVSVLHLGGVPADDLVDLFPRCGLVIGNDTGLTHLAALARMPDGSGPPVVGLYARHSHSKWRTGWPHHHAVATGFSDRMHQGDLCPVRDVIGEVRGADLSAITPALLARSCTDLLMEGSR